MLKNGNGDSDKPQDQSGTTSGGPGKTRELTRPEKVKTVPSPPPKKDDGKPGGGGSDG